ncbi:hypothetical protein FHX37_2904 [Haloactinospora alba]|uniref:Uncharacterized protein n=1 Tax=Haloactinospora alba TaxID=405555 RepID=A0A543NM56_9ACTN|nr:hypothetical protein [Haloactinospora alba]TQN32916.1 hypothetical protein FHX37_2904 [Haloactinospora alba]
MELARIAGDCPDRRTCPTLYETDRDTVLVQGYELPPEEHTRLAVPEGESVVEIPKSLLQEAARADRV